MRPTLLAAGFKQEVPLWKASVPETIFYFFLAHSAARVVFIRRFTASIGRRIGCWCEWAMCFRDAKDAERQPAFG